MKKICMLTALLALAAVNVRAQTNSEVNNLQVDGTATVAALNCKSIEGVRCVDAANTQGWAGSDQGQQLNAAMTAAVGTGDSTVFVFGSGTWSTNIFNGISAPMTVQYMTCASVTVSATQIPANNYQKLIGVNPGCTTIFLNNATFDLLAPTANNFEFGFFMVRTSVTRTAGWVVNPGHALNGYVHNLYILDTFNGFKFAGAAGVAPSGWTIDTIIFNESGGTTSGTEIQVGGGDGTGVSGITSRNILSAGDLSTHSTPKFVVDGGTDTIVFWGLNDNYSQGNPSTQPVISIQNTTGSINPRWITFEGNTSIEGGYNGAVTGADCLVMSQGNHVVFDHLYAVSCARGVVYSGGNGLKIKEGIIASNKTGGFINTAAITNANLELGAIDFVNNSRGTTNTTDDITILAGTTGFKVIGASFGTNNLGAPAQKSRYGINLGGAGTDVFTVTGIDCNLTNMGTNCLNDPGTALNAIVQNGFDTAGQSSLKIYSNCTSSNSCAEIKNTNPSGQAWRLGEFYRNGDFSFRNSVTGSGYTFPSVMGNHESFVVANICNTSQKAETAADANVLTCAPPAVAGSYRIRVALSLSAASAATVGWTATWTDSNGNAQAPANLSLLQSGTAAPALTFTTSAAGNYYGDAQIDINNAATSIVIKLTFAGTSFTGKVSATIERII